MKKIYFNKNKTAIFFIWLLLFFCFSFVDAHEIKIDFNKKTINIGEEIVLNVFLDTQEPINTISITINFPDELLNLKKINDGGSIVSLWIERPKMKTLGEVELSGIIPGGFWGDGGNIISLVFEAKDKGQVLTYLTNAKLFANDGKGTEVKVKTGEALLDIKNIINEYGHKINFDEDFEKPEKFMLYLARDENIFDNKWFVAFETQDKNSGINKYQVLENYWGKLFLKKWDDVVSPYVLKDQSLRSFVFIKAIDNAGNERVSKIEPKNKFNNLNILIISALAFGIIFYIWKKIKKL